MKVLFGIFITASNINAIFAKILLIYEKLLGSTLCEIVRMQEDLEVLQCGACRLTQWKAFRWRTLML